ncbi:hypothetical protein PFICI_00527 [Pestalotiopsis fici W106-1]|uniref:Uncharacterized protein n=1 Tax=Pestalotiopsis fici (strain W106-1 / CGMCC3.15140) TaxID=1229662 RepID=W3XL14_PESFW|nr:uncharacterized protein PFICI_00527 [Pestalotiopsis fici W106-1]ETS86699.1 hypothetical protein PFICI_00527 [Pestalotiopsis fici W106-1]
MKYSQIATSLLLAGSALAAPSAKVVAPRSSSAADLILAIAPDSASCDSSNDECRTNVQAAPLLIDAFDKYDIRTTAEIAGILSLMAYESVNFAYKRNKSPGRPGQGTANMQMFDYNVKYAATLSDLTTQVAALGTITTDDGKNQLLDLVVDDQYNFGSGPWFYSTQCTDAQRTALQKGDDDGFAQYMACVGVTVTDDRNAYWTRAKTAFGL